MNLALWGEVTFSEKVLGQACRGPGTTRHVLQAPPPSPAKEVNSLPSGDRGGGKRGRDLGSGRARRGKQGHWIWEGSSAGEESGRKATWDPSKAMPPPSSPQQPATLVPGPSLQGARLLASPPPCSTGCLCLSWWHWLSHARKSHTSTKARRSQHVRFTDSEFAGGHRTIKSDGIFRDVRDFTNAPSQSVTRSRLCQKVFVSCRGTFPESLTFHPSLYAPKTRAHKISQESHTHTHTHAHTPLFLLKPASKFSGKSFGK